MATDKLPPPSEGRKDELPHSGDNPPPSALPRQPDNLTTYMPITDDSPPTSPTESQTDLLATDSASGKQAAGSNEQFWDEGVATRDLLPEKTLNEFGFSEPLQPTERAVGELKGRSPSDQSFQVVYPGESGYEGERPVTNEEFASWPKMDTGRHTSEGQGGFIGDVRPVWIDPRTTDLFRYIDRGENSMMDGSWWFRGEIPESEIGARPDLAIKGDWNAMSNIVHLDTAEPIRAFVGKGRAVDGAEGYFPGGTEQIYIPRSEAYKIREGGISGSPSPWNPEA